MTAQAVRSARPGQARKRWRPTFSSVLGGAQEDVRAALFAVFTDLVQQRFGMSWQELYALPVW